MEEHDTVFEDAALYPEELVRRAQNPPYFGRMNDPTASACIKGPCGDEMEMYLVIVDKKIIDIKFYAEGCIATRVCGSMAAELVHGKFIIDALGISPKDIMSALPGLPEDHSHCSILAVTTLYRAIVDYLFKP